MLSGYFLCEKRARYTCGPLDLELAHEVTPAPVNDKISVEASVICHKLDFLDAHY